MSKTSVPDVYARVIRDVCESSRQDFEEGGIDLGALKLLEQGWQKRLSDLKIARFPWDPNPEPAPKTEPTPASNSKPAPTTLPSNGNVNSPSSSHSTPGPTVKQESQNHSQQQSSAAYQMPQYAQGQPMNPQQRAAMHLHQRFGNQAGNQIAQLQNAAQQRVPLSQPTQPQQQPFIKQEEGGSQSYPQNQVQQASVKTSQTDGASDLRNEYEAEIARRRAFIADNRETSTRIIREHFLVSQQELEGGGLLRPLDSHRFVTSNTQRQLRSLESQDISVTGHEPYSSLARAQGDAAGNDEEDEDAINSDLDDPDELDDNENDEDNVHEVMLCTYDKVQRVKNKWKCTLKDGILKVDGADYVFHKGQGEFEW